MGHCFSHLTKTDRYKIEALLKAKQTPQEIADIIHVSVSTIYREIKRARTIFRNSDWTEEERYNPDEADRKYREKLALKGAPLKIEKDFEFANYIESKIADEHLSPEAALHCAELEGRQFKTHICRVTLYSYIDKGVFLRVTNKDLPVKPNKKKKKKKVQTMKKPPCGDSIEKRPEEVENREIFGHWEGDTVYSGKKKAKEALFVLTERKTRKEIIEKMPDRTKESAVAALDRVQARYGDRFKEIFQTITFDNGVEFSDVDGLERSADNPDEKRTKVYYCHPYSSFERGSNENQNRMVRRWYPKGTDFSTVSDEDISRLEGWINNYPRKLLGWQTSEILFNSYLFDVI